MDLIKKLDALGDVGATPTGITRVAGTAADDDAKTLVASWMRDAGMQVTWDVDDNIVGYLKGDDMSLPLSWSVPTLTLWLMVVSMTVLWVSLPVSRQRRHCRANSEHPLKIVAFHDEERTMDGSKAFAEKNDPIAFLELHVEQGPVLERWYRHWCGDWYRGSTPGQVHCVR